MNTTNHFPPMADNMRPQAMNDRQLIETWEEAAEDIACYLAGGLTASNDSNMKEACKDLLIIEREVAKRGIMNHNAMANHIDDRQRHYARMQ